MPIGNVVCDGTRKAGLAFLLRCHVFCLPCSLSVCFSRKHDAAIDQRVGDAAGQYLPFKRGEFAVAVQGVFTHLPVRIRIDDAQVGHAAG